jgi:uncharacterized protein with PIN domain
VARHQLLLRQCAGEIGGLPLLFKSDDFARTDVTPVLV